MANDRNALEHLVARCATDPWFLGSALAAYQQRQNLDDAALASVLGCDVAVLLTLRLCRMPGVAEPHRTMEEDITDIADTFGVNAAALRRIVEFTPNTQENER